MRIVSWNVNSLNVRLPQVLQWLKDHQPDVLCLQETKLEDANFPLAALQAAGYEAAFIGQRTYNGVAILSRHPLQEVETGIPGFEDEQRRVIAATVNGVRVVNLYVPNGEALDSPKFEYKGRWLEALKPWLARVVNAYPQTVVLGDFNIAPQALDVWNPKRLEGQVLFSPFERQSFAQILELGFHDSLRQIEPSSQLFTWWDFRGGGFQRNQGLRIDHILVSSPLAGEVQSVWVDREARAVARASDHAPIVCDLFEKHSATPAPTIHAGEQGIPDATEQVAPSGRLANTRDKPTAARSVILIDGHSLAFRMYFGVPPVKAPDGTPVHAVLGFMRALLEVYREHGGQPTSDSGEEGPALVVVFDAPVATFRHQLFPDYKGGRDDIPQDLPAQIRWIKLLVDAMGWIRLEIAEVEADDAIGTLAKRAEQQGLGALILSSDRDLYQLLSEKVKVRGKEGKPFGPEELLAQYGVSPAQWVDYRSLTGDSSDNIPGAKGVGEKTASGLIQRFGHLDAILEAAEGSEPDRPLKLVAASRDNVRLSRTLAQIKLDVDIPVSFDEAATVVRNEARLRELMDQLGFKSLKRELHLGEGEGNLPQVIEGEAEVRPEVENFKEPVVGFSDEGWVLLEGETLIPLSPEQIPSTIHAIGAKGLVNQQVWAGKSVEIGDDPLLMAYLEDSRINSPDKLAERYAQTTWPTQAPERARLTQRLLGLVGPKLRPNTRQLYEQIERPLSSVLAHMEVRGICLDVEYLAGLLQGHKTRLAELEEAIFGSVGKRFKVSSRNQLETLLFDELKLESSRQTALTNKRSTDNETLTALREAHPVIPLLLEHRELAKLVGTYLEPLPKLVSPQTGRLHTTFDQVNAATGRLASINPNLQNIPIRTDLGRPIRGAFVAAPGYRLISADYSQIELRILAHLSGDLALVAAFESGEDIHRVTASKVADIPLQTVTREQRNNAKAINYGLSYGLSIVGLAERTGMSRGEASKFIKRYFEQYPGIEGYIKTTKAFCKEHGYVEDLYGRRRYIPDIAAPGAAIRNRAENAAINMPVQGTCASIIKQAMVVAFPKLRELGAHLLLQVHDELVVEAPEDRVEEVAKVLQSEMENAGQLRVRLEVEAGYGTNWLEAHG